MHGTKHRKRTLWCRGTGCTPFPGSEDVNTISFLIYLDESDVYQDTVGDCLSFTLVTGKKSSK